MNKAYRIAVTIGVLALLRSSPANAAEGEYRFGGTFASTLGTTLACTAVSYPLAAAGALATSPLRSTLSSTGLVLATNILVQVAVMPAVCLPIGRWFGGVDEGLPRAWLWSAGIRAGILGLSTLGGLGSDYGARGGALFGTSLLMLAGGFVEAMVGQHLRGDAAPGRLSGSLRLGATLLTDGRRSLPATGIDLGVARTRGRHAVDVRLRLARVGERAASGFELLAGYRHLFRAEGAAPFVAASAGFSQRAALLGEIEAGLVLPALGARFLLGVAVQGRADFAAYAGAGLFAGWEY